MHVYPDDAAGPEPGEEDILHALKREDEAAVRRLLSSWEARRCPLYSGLLLVEALHGSPQIFSELLDHYEPGEHFESVTRPVNGKPGLLTFNGTILLLAAVLNRCGHIRVLLERGWDCNGASLSAQAPYHPYGSEDYGACVSSLGNVCFRPEPPGRAGDQTEPVWSMIYPTPPTDPLIVGCTPLSAAVLCGNLEAAELLAAQPGIWKEESPSVCRAVLLAEEGEPFTCVKLLFPEACATIPEGGGITKTLRLLPWAIADLCTPQQLQDQLEGWTFTRQELRRVLKRLDIPGNIYGYRVRYRAQKLLLMAAHAPELCREPWAAGLFLRAVLTAAGQDRPYRRLLHCWERLSGPVGDLSWAWSCISGIPIARLRKLLKELGAKTHLVLDADCVTSGRGAGVPELLVRHVEILPSQWEGGVSGFSAMVLGSNNLRMAETVARCGGLCGESKIDLLRCVEGSAGAGMLRPLLLTGRLEGGRSVPAGWRRPDVGEYLRGGVLYGVCHRRSGQRLQDMEWAARQRWLEETYLGELPAEERLRRIVTEKAELYMGLASLSVSHPRWGALKEVERGAAVCCTENPAALETMLLTEPWLVRENFWGSVPDVGRMSQALLHAMPLCWAAAAGRTAQLRLLLDHGAAVNEEDCGRCSWLTGGLEGEPGKHTIFITPLLCALAMGEEGAARLLLEAGARFDLRDAAVQRAVGALFSQAARELTARLLNLEPSQLPEPEERGWREPERMTPWLTAGEDDLPF